ncbi:response regulator [Desulfobotulus sp.]|uniref:response regulator n=1 Tax=Desulfobotulus sp. TaxID=1940337 RepID=UPI002A3725B0|nr:response regulator [Desulfobotulus sp.]MDY0161616.1 response regulator [Desulfobotulus sp.]
MMAGNGVRVLVVDDDMFSAELAAMALEEGGLDVVVAEGGMDALEKVATDSGIAVVVSDMHMPFINGVQLLEALREHGFFQPFVLLTADDVTALRAKHPAIAAIVAKDGGFQETLFRVVADLLVTNRTKGEMP